MYRSWTVMGSLLVCLTLSLLSPVAAQQPRISGTVSIASTSIAVGIGVNWGDGILHTGGKRYPFEVSGLEVGAIGVSNVQATGDVYHLGKVEHFEGAYVAAAGGATIGSGEGVLTMRNQHGVVVNLHSVQQGVKLTAGGQGISIKLKK